MTAFSRNLSWQMKNNITRLGKRIVNSHRSEMTSNELLEIYTKPEDREILTKVFSLVKMDSTTRYWSHPYAVEGGTVSLSIYIDHSTGDKKWLVPKYAEKGPVEGANPEIVAKLDKWMKKRIALGVECAMVHAVFDELNWRCRAPASMKFFMPTVLDLLDMIEDDAKAAELRDKLSTGKVPPLPTLPPAMQDVLAGVSATVARGRLMDKKSEDRADGRVRFSISQGSKGLSETPWGTSLTLV